MQVVFMSMNINMPGDAKHSVDCYPYRVLEDTHEVVQTGRRSAETRAVMEISVPIAGVRPDGGVQVALEVGRHVPRRVQVRQRGEIM